MSARFFALFFTALTVLHAEDSPQPREDTALAPFLAALHPGMTEKSFNDVVSRFLLKDGLAFIPLLVSLSDPDRHLYIPAHGGYDFSFDRQRRLTAWKAWKQDAANSFSPSCGAAHATFTEITDSTSKPK